MKEGSKIKNFSAEMTGNKEFKLNEITAYLKNLGAEHDSKKVKGKFLNTWSVPNFEMQTEQFTQPEIKKEAYE